MGQKVNPKGFRIGPVYGWSSRWFADKKRYHAFLYQDVKLRQIIFLKLKPAGVCKVEIERSINKMKVIIHVSKPGIVIGRGGTGLEELKKLIEGFLSDMQKDHMVAGKKTFAETGNIKVELSVEPVKEPNLNAYLVATSIADQIVRRMPHKRVCNQTLERVMSAGAKGVKIALSGRIAGAEIARHEKYKAGSVPLSTIREKVDYEHVPALTKSGYVGVKVWICLK
ncbi:30S ribosomal protein S3 [Candidatus Gottesmanbacteria bacterium]|nr:30S ribosomal protein S3 [Candidatus Gottesmanbacteria bacterium]